MQLQKSKKILIYFFLFFIIGSINNKNLNSLYLPKINEIYVYGLHDKKNLELEKNLNHLKLKNIFFLDSEEIKSILKKNNLIEKYSIFKRYPASLEIKIIQTSFLAYTKIDTELFLLGSNGKYIKTDNKEYDIPFIFGNFSSEDFLNLKNTIEDSEFDLDEIRNFYSFKSGRWDIETNSGLLIKLPNKEIKKSLKILKKLLIEKQFKNIDIVDLRQNNQVIIYE